MSVNCGDHHYNYIYYVHQYLSYICLYVSSYMCSEFLKNNLNINNYIYPSSHLFYMYLYVLITI